MKPAVSICIPTYNGADFLQECLDSILDQTYSDFELIIVDDKSCDRTIEIAKAYASKDPRITVVENPLNLGLVGNWNRCIELSQCEWVKFVFQDDIIAPNYLERMLGESTPDCDLIFCRRNFIFEANVSEGKRREYERYINSDKALPSNTQITAFEYCEAIISQPWENIIGEPTSSMVRKRAFDRFGGFNPNLIQICDLELWDRIATNVGIVFVRENLVSFRIHNESTTSKNHASRHFRMELDSLILAHDFAFHPAYENLRNFCMGRGKINLVKLMMMQAYYLWRRGKYIILKQPEESQSIEQVWEEIMQKYPRLTQVKSLNFLKKFEYRATPRVESFKRNTILKINTFKCRLNSLFSL
jgi:glycosyltransferase involved in cell wall biosynthesis